MGRVVMLPLTAFDGQRVVGRHVDGQLVARNVSGSEHHALQQRNDACTRFFLGRQRRKSCHQRSARADRLHCRVRQVGCRWQRAARHLEARDVGAIAAVLDRPACVSRPLVAKEP